MYLSKQVKDSYDIIVVGAGPTGSTAARVAAAAGAEVLLLEKDREAGMPVRCAEAVAKRDVENLLGHELSPGWIAATISKFRLFAPDGTPVFVHIDETGYILHRKLFDYALSLEAVNAGAQLITSAEVYDVVNSDEQITGVNVRIDNTNVRIAAKIVLAADGVESRAARWAGIDSTTPVKEMETCAQYTLADIDVDTDTCDFYFSRDFAPGGYAWVFPKGNRTANVGLGIAGNFARKTSPEKYLDIFLDRFFPKASVASCTMGAVPVDKILKEIVKDGFMVAGDAAHQVNPISGGGIISGMIAGTLAGDVAAQAVKKGDLSRKELLSYSRQWQKRVGKQHQRYYRLKEALMKFEDQQFNNIAADYLALPDIKRTLPNLFKIAFKNNPAFLLDVVKIFAGFK